MELNASFLIQFTIFMSLYFVMRALLFQPMLRVLSERDARMIGAAEEAKALRALNMGQAESIEAQLSEANSEARRILLTYRERGKSIEKEQIEKARELSQHEIEQAKKEIAATLRSVRPLVEQESQILAQNILEQVIERAAA